MDLRSLSHSGDYHDCGCWLLHYRQIFLEERGLIAATHGFDHEAPEMRTIFMASGPSFTPGKTVPAFSALNLYELMAHLLGGAGGK